MKKILLLVLAMISLSAAGQSQVSGTVLDQNNSPLPGVNIVVQGTTRGVQTDFDGNFSIDLNTGETLLFSYVGFAAQEIIYNGQASIQIVMEEDSDALDEVVVVGYGTKKKSLVTGAISSIEASEIKSSSNQQVEQALQGRTSGVTVVSSSGAPGSSSKVRIRGAGSNGNADPLYIVDGLKVSGIDNIIPSDIANIEILKDAASSAIYGTDGANGVILITTKKGKLGDPVISYNTQGGFQSVRTSLELMNAEEFAIYNQEAGRDGVVENGIDTDWIDATFEDAFFQRHDLSFSGATDRTSYYISGSLLDQDGVVGRGNSSFKRYSIRTNIKSDVKDWLEIGTNLSYTNYLNSGIPENSDTRGVIANALILDPMTPVTYQGAVPQSVIDRSESNGVPLLTDRNGDVYGYPTYSTGEVLNPVAYAKNISDSRSNNDKFIGTFYAKLALTEGLSFTTRYAVERGNFSNKNLTIPYFVSSEAQNTQYLLNESLARRTTWLWENFATYDKSFGNHDLSLLLGYSAEDTKSPNYRIAGSSSVLDYTDPFFDFFQEFTDPNGNLFRDNLVSMYGRISYSYMDKYLLEGSLRRDTSDKFPSANRSGYFPAISAGWVPSNEGFWNEDGAFNYFKLRGSWGQNGSRRNLGGNSDLLFFINQIAANQGGPLIYEGLLAVQAAFIPNPDLKWEVSEQLDLGLDLRAFDNRLNFAFDYYVKTTRDLAINDGSLISPGSAGGRIREFNGGTIRNKGLEFELGWADETNSGFSYGINLNLSTLDNEVTEITGVPEGSFIRGAGAPQNNDGITRFEEGEPLWYFYGYETDGINPETGEINRVDTNGDGDITSDDKTNIGSPHPDLLFGGNINLGYKGFDFNLRFQGTAGNDIIATYHQPSRPVTNKPVHWFEDRWTPNNTNASFPAAEFATSAYDTDLVVDDGSYVRIKQIQLGYTLPQKFTEKMNLKNLRFYVSLDDYFTFTKYRGLDPEAGSFDDNAIGVDRGFYPIASRAILGLSLDF